MNTPGHYIKSLLCFTSCFAATVTPLGKFNELLIGTNDQQFLQTQELSLLPPVSELSMEDIPVRYILGVRDLSHSTVDTLKSSN